MGDDYQTELPLPPAFPKHFKNINADNEVSKSVKEEDRERFNPEEKQVGERIEQDAEWASDITFDFSDWERDSDSKGWDFDGELIVGIILILIAITLLVFLGLMLSKIRFKKKFKDDVNETGGILEHLESFTKNQNHEELALLGDFDIAVHALLLKVLRVIFKVDDDLDRPSTTAREIGEAYKTSPQISVDLAPLIQIVEWSRFAKRPANEENYKDLLPRSERLMAIFEEKRWRQSSELGEQ